MNPWGVTDTEAAFLDALCEIGTVIGAAKALMISEACARSRLQIACIRMAGDKPAARALTKVARTPTIIACIKWAQWTKEHAK
jgi:hypothetical protein